jgi:hypothetical protein
MGNFAKILGIVVFSSFYVWATDFAKMSREERCRTSGGEVASPGAPQQNTKSAEAFPFGPIDCTCGGKRFNPLHEGDRCQNGKIQTALEHLCQNSHGMLVSVPFQGDSKIKQTKKFKPMVQKCRCGSTDFEPTKTTMCENDKLNRVKDNSSPQ